MSISAVKFFSCFLAGATLAGALTLTGCGVDPENAASAAEAPAALPAISGHVHGGAYPIQKAEIQLYETGVTGTSTPQALDTTESDQYGYFNFSSGDQCKTSTDYIYITVNGGYSGVNGANPNANLVQVGVIGSCSDISNSTLAAAVNVYVSELSTVAAAYTLGSFITFDGSNDVLISAPAANYATAACSGAAASLKCTSAGLAHGFTLASELVNSVTTSSATTFPTGLANYIIGSNTASILPFVMINTIGDVLQQCVDSNGVASQSSISGSTNDGSVCGELFEYSTTPSGQVPTTTLQAAMFLAKYPNGYPTPNLSQSNKTSPCTSTSVALYADCNTAAQELYNLITPKVQPFQPSLSSAPISYTLTVDYGLMCSNANTCGSEMPYPVDLALDYSDTAYVLFGGAATGNTYSAVDTINSSGTTITAGTKNTTYTYPTQIAVDTHGYVFVTNNDPVTTNDGVLMNGSGTLTLAKVATVTSASGIAVDRSSRVWVSSATTSGNSVFGYSESSLENGAGLPTPYFYSQVAGVPVVGLAIDANQDIWGVSSASSAGTSDAVLLPYNASTASYGTSGSAGIEKSLTYGSGASVAINSSSTAYFPLYGRLGSATYANSAIAVGGSPVANPTLQPARSQVDGKGDVFWVDSSSGGLLYEALSSPAGTVSAINPCYATGSGTSYSCFVSNTSGGEGSATYRSLAIDSQGNLWLAADAPYNGGVVGAVVEVLGVGWAAWPQLSYGHAGCTPGAGTTACP